MNTVKSTVASPGIFTVVVDTREKRGYRFTCPVEEKALPVGDYSVAGLEGMVVVERKGFDDVYKCLSGDRGRFEVQLRKLSKIPHRALVLDTTVNSLLIGHAHCALSGINALDRLLTLCVKHGIAPIFAGTKGPLVTQMLLATWVKEYGLSDA